MLLTSAVPCCSQSTWQIRFSSQHLAPSDLTVLWPGKRGKKGFRTLTRGCFHFPFPCLCCMRTQPALHPLDSPWTPCGAQDDVSAGHKSQPTILSAACLRGSTLQERWLSPSHAWLLCSLPALMPGGNALHPCSPWQFLQTHLPAPVACSGQGVEGRQFWGSHPSTSRLCRPLRTFIAHLWTLLLAV